MIKKTFLFISLFVLFIIFAQDVNAEDCFEPLPPGVMGPPEPIPCRTPYDQFWGDQPTQEQLPAVLQGSVNAFNGNVILSETDLSLPGRGLDLTITRTYNSNFNTYSSNIPSLGRKFSFIKPSWLGYGWDFNMGKIRLIENPDNLCDKLDLRSTENIVQFPDGSVSRFITPTNSYPGEIYLDNNAKVNVYNGGNSYPIATNPTGYFEIIGRDGTKYIFNHWVTVGKGCNKIDPIDEIPGSNPWTDAGNAYEQHQYVGVYLTRIEDPFGNYINVDYYDQTWRDPNDATIVNVGGTDLRRAEAFGYNDASHPVSYGSPFIKKITDTMGREINFFVDDDQSILGKLDYIEYENVNNKKVRVNYVYSNELAGNPYSGTCDCQPGAGQNICLDVCDGNSLLSEVRYEDSSGNLLYPSTTYNYDSGSGSNSIFKLTGVNSPDKGITTYEYGDFIFCSTGGRQETLNVLKNYTLKENTTSSGLLYQYDYFPPQGNCEDWMRSTVLIGPKDENGKMTVSRTDHFLQLVTGAANFVNLEWRSGLEKSSSVHEATIYDFASHQPINGPATGWLSTVIQSEKSFYKPIKIGTRKQASWTGSNWVTWDLDWYIPVKEGSLREVYGEPSLGGKKTYFTKFENIDKYGHPRLIKNWGEVTGVSKTYTGPLITSNLVGNIVIDDFSPNGESDNVITRVKYLYEDDDYYEGADDKSFQSLDLVSEEEILDDSNTRLSHVLNYFDIVGRSVSQFYTNKFFGKDNYQNHMQPIYTPVKKGALQRTEAWEDSENIYLQTRFYYDDSGNLIETRDPKGHLSFAFYDIEGVQDYANVVPVLGANTCNDGIDNDGDGCIDVEGESNDPCNLYSPGDPNYHEGVINTYGGDSRISSTCDDSVFVTLEDPACIENSANIRKCDNPVLSPSSPSLSVPGGGGIGNEISWDDKKHGFLTKSKSTLLNGKSITKRNDYYSTGQIKTETDFGVSSKSPLVTQYTYDDLGRLTTTYLTGDVPGNPTGFIIYNDNFPRSETIYTKRISNKILVIDMYDGTSYDPVGELLNVLNSFNYDYKLVSKLSGLNSITNLNDYNLVLFISGNNPGSFVENDATQAQAVTNLQTYLDSGGNLWIMGVDSVFQNLLSDVQLISFANNYLHLQSTTSGNPEQTEILSIDGVSSTFFDGSNFNNLQQPFQWNLREFIGDAFTKVPFTEDVKLGNFDPLMFPDGIDTKDISLSYNENYKVLLTNFDLSFTNDVDDGLLVSKAFLWFSLGDNQADNTAYFNPITTKYDLLGREIGTEQLDMDGNLITTIVTYNAQGKKKEISRPFKPADPILTTSFLEYDALGRTKEISFPNVVKTLKTVYGANYVEQTDRNDVVSKIESDAYGRVVKVTKALGTTEESVTISKYNLLGNLISVINPKNQELLYNYNSLNWLLSRIDPNSGTTINEYDSNGNPSKVTYANGKINTFTYDVLNRLVKKRDSLGNSVLYKYIADTGESLNKVTEIVDQSGTRKFEYDSRGRLIKETLNPNCGCSSGCVDLNSDGKVDSNDNFDTVNNFKNKDFNGDGSISNFDRTCFDALFLEYNGLDIASSTGMCPASEERCSNNPRVRTYSYDFADNIVRIDDNDGNFYDYSYDNLGRLAKVEYNGNIISQNYVYNPHGSITGFDLGDGASKVTNTFGYYEREVDLVNSQSSSSASEGIIFRREYLYDDVNNLIEEKPTKTSVTPIKYFYDKLYRLTSVTDSSDDIYPGITTIEYNYDLIGNRLNKITDGNIDAYNYDPLNSDSKLLSVDNSDGSISNYEYDLNGNLIRELIDNQLIKEFSYDSYNQLMKVDFSDGNCIRYYYNSDGNRVREEDGVNNIITSYDYDSSSRLISELKWHGPVACNAICGNGLVEEGEVCDSSAPPDRTCRDFSTPQNRYYNQDDAVSCRSDCTGFDVAPTCIDGTCGDGILQYPYEQCEWQGNTKIFWSLDERKTFSTTTAASCSTIHNSWDDKLSSGAVGCGAVGTPNECRYEPSSGSFGNTCACDIDGSTVFGMECLGSRDGEDYIIPNIDPRCDEETGTCSLK